MAQFRFLTILLFSLAIVVLVSVVHYNRQQASVLSDSTCTSPFTNLTSVQKDCVSHVLGAPRNSEIKNSHTPPTSSKQPFIYQQCSQAETTTQTPPPPPSKNTPPPPPPPPGKYPPLFQTTAYTT